MPSHRCALLPLQGVKHSKLNFDALEYAPGNQGNIIRASVQELTGAVTFPQVGLLRISPRTLTHAHKHTDTRSYDNWHGSPP